MATYTRKGTSTSTRTGAGTGAGAGGGAAAASTGSKSPGASSAAVPPGVARPTGPAGPTGPTGPAGPVAAAGASAGAATGGVTAGGVTSGGVTFPVSAQPTGPATTQSTGSGSAQPTSSPAPGTGEISAVDSFLALLRGDDLNIEAPVNDADVVSAIALFSISAVLLAGLGKRRVGNEDKIDALGMLTLYYGLQDKSLVNQISVNSQKLWNSEVVGDTVLVQDELKKLRDLLDTFGQDVVFLTREARRQFNLGVTNEVAANVTFPQLIKRYVDVASDPLLTMDLRQEEQPGSFTSKDRIAAAFDLLSDLKALLLQIVRSLSKYGTIAVESSSREWATFEKRALRVLDSVGRQRFTQDDDEKRVLSVLADLTGKNFDTVIAPYFTLARNGGRLLALAYDTYLASRGELDNFEREHLLDLFQPQGNVHAFRTTQMRKEALVMKRYPLASWN